MFGRQHPFGNIYMDRSPTLTSQGKYHENYGNEGSEGDLSSSEFDEGDRFTPEQAISQCVKWFTKVSPNPVTNRTGLVYDRRMQKHFHPYQKHPECPERTLTIMGALESSGLKNRMFQLPVRTATDAELLLVHTPEHLSYVNSLIDPVKRKENFLSLERRSAYASEGSVEAAYVSCGSVLSALDHLVSGKIRNALCVVRPPGHHAERDEVCGFCLFDNVAVAASVAVKEHGFKRVLILGKNFIST